MTQRTSPDWQTLFATAGVAITAYASLHYAPQAAAAGGLPSYADWAQWLGPLAAALPKLLSVLGGKLSPQQSTWLQFLVLLAQNNVIPELTSIWQKLETNGVPSFFSVRVQWGDSAVSVADFGKEVAPKK